MAATATKDAATDAKTAKKGSPLKSKKAIILVVVLLAVAGGAYKMLAPKPKPGPPTGGAVVKLAPATLNLAGGHYLKIAVNVQLVKGKATPATFETSEAMQLVINEYSNRSVASVSSDPARLALQKDLETKMKAAYPGEVWKTFVTQFVTFDT